MVYRGTNLPDKIQKDITTTKLYTFPENLSTSLDINEAKSFGSVLFHIKVKLSNQKKG
jgi:hypothetical protein